MAAGLVAAGGALASTRREDSLPLCGSGSDDLGIRIRLPRADGGETKCRHLPPQRLCLDHAGQCFFPHLLAAIWLNQYVPGLGTAVALNLPSCSAFLFVVLKEDYVSLWPLLITGCIFAGGALTLIPMLFKLGEGVEEKYWS